MTRKSKFTEDFKQLESSLEKNENLIERLDDFVFLINKSKLEAKTLQIIKSKINKAIDDKINNDNIIKELQNISESELDKLEQLDQLEFILNNNHLDSKLKKKTNHSERIMRLLKITIGFLFVTLGFAMIIMPAPPYFEMFTIFYFTTNDGVTLMDLISLIIIAVGTYIIVKSGTSQKSYE